MKRVGSFGIVLAILVTSSPALAGTWVYLREGGQLFYRPGTSAPPADWTDREFQEDSSWTSSEEGFGIGYGDGDDRTVVSDMQDHYVTLYVRAHFIAGAEQATTLQLDVSFDDGFVAYLNGTEVARSHVPAGALGPDDTASGHEVTDGVESFTIDPGLLVEGDNVLAVEVHNASLGSSDLSFDPVLWGYDSPPLDAQITLGPFLQQLDRRSVLVVWETDQPAPTDIVYGPAEDDMSRSVSDSSLVTHHVAALTDLLPQSSYTYRVESAKWPSSVGHVRTMKDSATAFRVGVYGDTRSQPDIHREVVEGIIASDVDLIFNTGDLVADGSDDGLWQTFFDVTAEMLRDVPLYPVLGNHEGTGDRYLDIFELPRDSSGTERYYAVRYGVALFVVIDLYGSDWDQGSAQYTWLEDLLSNAASDQTIFHRFVFLHHGPYDSGSHGPNTQAQAVLVPLFEQYGVEIVFSGHDHDYERGTVNGVKYVVTGGGGAPLYPVDGDWWTEVSASVYHYVILDVSGPRVDFTATRLDGTVLDQFVLGDDLSECSGAGDCESRQSGTCQDDEAGAWACVAGGCVWNCHLQAPPERDAGTADAAPDSGGDAGTWDAGVFPADASASRDESSGCGCRSGKSRPPGSLWLLVLLLLPLSRRGLSR